VTRWDLQLGSLLPGSLLSCERVSVWAMLLATPPVAGEAAVLAGDAVVSDFLCVRCFFAGEGDSAGLGD
jgi:hypothetical protein